MAKKITVLAGDGIGPEIMAAGLEILQTISELDQLSFEITAADFGGVAIDHFADPLPPDTLSACQTADAVLLAAIGGPKWEQAERTPEMGLLELRQALQLFANLRPIKVTPALSMLSPLKAKIAEKADFIVVRELTSGIYFGTPRELTATSALDTNTYQADEIKRILKKAFEIARTRKKKVTSVDKANVLATSKLWRQLAEEVAADYPDCLLQHQYVDSAAMKIISQPEEFDVIVTENLFGDILSDEASVLPGSLGLLASGSHSINGPSLYEPIHGSAPDIAGTNTANPLSMIYSVTMMLKESFGLTASAEKIEQACDQVLANGVMTKDLGGTAKTTEFTVAVIKQLKEDEEDGKNII